MRNCIYSAGEIIQQPETVPCVPWLNYQDNALVDLVDESTVVDVITEPPYEFPVLGAVALIGVLLLAMNIRE